MDEATKHDIRQAMLTIARAIGEQGQTMGLMNIDIGETPEGISCEVVAVVFIGAKAITRPRIEVVEEALRSFGGRKVSNEPLPPGEVA